MATKKICDICGGDKADVEFTYFAQGVKGKITVVDLCEKHYNELVTPIVKTIEDLKEQFVNIDSIAAAPKKKRNR